MTNPFLAIDQKMVGDIYTSTAAMDNLAILCDRFGARFGGTEEERLAAEFLTAKLNEYGLSNVHREPVEYTRWIRGTARLALTAPIQKTLPCITLPYSPAVEMEAEVIDLGDGAPALFEQRADEIAGKVVMVNSKVWVEGTSRWMHRQEKFGRSLMAGAAGFIFMNHYPAYGPATGTIGNGTEAPIPGLGLAYEDGALIRRLIEREGRVTVRLSSDDRCQPATSWNIIGELPGQRQPETAGEIVMLGCHYDGHDISQGATDPASGLVCLLEAARVLAIYAPDLPRTVRFVLWGVEEVGLLGSKAYVARHAAELDAIRFYLNLDSAGARYNDVMLNEWPELAPLFAGWSKEIARDFAVGQSVLAFSDHYPLFRAGVPTGGLQPVRTQSSGRGFGHTRYDTLDKVEPDTLRDTSALAARLTLRLSHVDAWPVRRRSQTQIKAVLDTPEYQEEVRYKAQLKAHLESLGYVDPDVE